MNKIVIKKDQVWFDGGKLRAKILCEPCGDWAVMKIESGAIPIVVAVDEFRRDFALVESHDGANLIEATAKGWRVWVEGVERPDNEMVESAEMYDDEGWADCHPAGWAETLTYRYKLKPTCSECGEHRNHVDLTDDGERLLCKDCLPARIVGEPFNLNPPHLCDTCSVRDVCVDREGVVAPLVKCPEYTPAPPKAPTDDVPKFKLFPLLVNGTGFYVRRLDGYDVEVVAYPVIDNYRVGWGYTDDENWTDRYKNTAQRGSFVEVPCDAYGNRRFAIGRLEV